ncbi:MAG TPA: hypothetical protein VGG68_15605 [Caulobacteraceae bacterium]
MPPDQPLNPQPGDVERLFQNQIMRQFPNSIAPGPGLADFIRRGLATAGDNI